MKMTTEESKRQYILEQAILSEIGMVRHLFTEARFRWEPEDSHSPTILTFNEYIEELNTLKIKIVGRLDNLLRSVTSSYSSVRREDETR
jgi:hypothetical protein